MVVERVRMGGADGYAGQVLMVGNFEERGNGSVGHRYYAFAHM